MKRHFLLTLFVLLSHPALAAIEMRGGINFSVVIQDGDTTPSTVDNTDFGEVVVPATKTVSFQVKAVGQSETLVVTENGTAWSISSGAGPVVLGSGSTHTFSVRLEPTAAGYKSATVVIGATSGNYSFTVEGNALGEPEISVSGRSDPNLSYLNISDGDTSPTGVDGTNFGSQDVAGGALSHTFQIENSGTESLTVDSISDDSSEFSITGVPTSVPVGGTRTFTVKFNPTSTGTKTATITLQNNDANEDPFTFEVIGSGEAPEIQVLGGTSQTVSIPNGDTTPRALDNTDFGTVIAGSSPLTRVFKIKNNGNHPLTVFSVTEDANAFSITSAPGPLDPIAPGGSDNFNIILETSTAGTKYGTVTITSDDPDHGVFTFDVTAEATGDPEIAVSGRLNELVAYLNIGTGDDTPRLDDGTDFGDQGVDDGFIEHTFRIQNNGNARLNITSISEDSPAFSIVNAPGSVSVGGEKTFGVRFNPAASGQKTATVTIENDDPDGGEGTFTFEVTGRGLFPKIQIYGGINYGEFIADGDDTPRTADNTDFGAVDAGIGTATSTFRIRNEGNRDLTLVSIVEDGAAFSIPAPPALPTTVPPGGSLDFSIEFAPVAAGSKAGTVTIMSNDTVQDRDRYTFDIVGEATGAALLEVAGRQTAALPYATIVNGDLAPSAIDGTDFGSISVAGDSETRTLRITNTGSAQLTIDSITESSAHFSVSDVPGVVGVGQSKTFDVTFDPTGLGTKTTTIRIATNASGEESFTFRISGTGLAPKIEAKRGFDGSYGDIPSGAPAPEPGEGAGGQDFGYRLLGDALGRAFSIHNAGNAALILTAITEGGSGWSIDADDPGLPFAVPPGAYYNYGIDFDPMFVGLHTTTVSIFSNDPDLPVYTFGVAGYGKGESMILVLGRAPGSPTTYQIPNGTTLTTTGNGTDFGDREESAGGISHTFEIRNDGTDTLNISSIAEVSPHFSVSGAPSAVAVGETEEFTITFDPTSIGRKTAEISIHSDAPDPWEHYTFNVAGIGEAPDLDVAGGSGFSENIENGHYWPSPFDGTDLGTVHTDSNAVTSTFRITNSGNESLVISGITSDHPDFTLTDVPSPGNPVAPGDWDEFTLAFDPSAVGWVTASIAIESNDPDENPFTFEVEGSGIDDMPRIVVTGKNGYRLLDGRLVPATVVGTDFGEVDINGVTRRQAFSIHNRGTGPLQIFSVTEGGARFDIQGTPSGSILPDESVDVTVLFNPDSETVHTATVSIANNDSDDGVFTFAVRGTGVTTPPPPAPDIAVKGGLGLHVDISNGDDTPRRFDGTDVGNIAVGESVTRTFRVENNGDADLILAQVILVGTPSAVAAYPGSIPAGGSDDFGVTFAPPGAGAFAGTLRIVSNDPDDSPFEFTVSSTGIQPVNLLQVTDLAVEGQNLTLTFKSDPLKTYRIAWTTELSDDPAAWNRPVAVSGLLGDVNEQPYLLPGVADSTRSSVFLRVEEE